MEVNGSGIPHIVQLCSAVSKGNVLCKLLSLQQALFLVAAEFLEANYVSTMVS